jgi:hypothetical protein
MSKIISGNDGPVFGINTSLDMFEKLRYESARLEQSMHPYDAFNFLVTAWHLFEDWAKSDDRQALCRMKRHRAKLPREMNLVLDVVKDIVNGSKHFKLDDRSAKKRRVGEVHTGEEVGWLSYLFRENLPAVTVDEHWYFSIRILNNLVLKFFEWVFDDSIPLRAFPEDLIEAILYCNTAERKSGPSPEIWLLGIESAYDNKSNAGN